MVCVVGEARDVDVGVARLHFVKGEVVRQNALWLVARGHGSPGGSLVASFLHACTKAWPCGGSTAASVHPPSCAEPGVEHPPCAKLHASGARERERGPSGTRGAVRLSHDRGRAWLAVDIYQAGHRYKPGLVEK